MSDQQTPQQPATGTVLGQRLSGDPAAGVPGIAEPIIPESIIAELRAGLRGPLLHHGDAEYESARQVWNGMIDRYPMMIARCTGAADVIRSVNFARDHGLRIAVKGGGHSFPGHSVCDGGMMIDLSRMKSIRVDPQGRTARAEPGVVWGELDRETSAFGLAVTGGQISHTGIAGLTLGGGFGWLARSFGMTVDNLLSVDIVTADGQLRHASATENSDLFWGVRGGGGNFGIVTSFEYRLRPLGLVTAGLVAHPLPAAVPAMQFFREFNRTSPDSLTLTGALMTTPEGHKAFGMAMCCTAPPDEAAGIVKPLLEYGPPVMTQVGPMPYPVLQGMLDGMAEPGRRYYIKSHMLDEVTDGAIEVLTRGFADAPSPFSTVIVVQLGGATNRVPADATAYPHRSVNYSVTVLTGWDDPADDERNISWVRGIAQGLEPYANGGVYINEMGDEGEQRIAAAYGQATLQRLVELKKKYDPENLFRLNQNIRPA